MRGDCSRLAAFEDVARFVVALEQRLDLPAQRLVAAARVSEKGAAFRPRPRDRVAEQLLGAAPSIPRRFHKRRIAEAIVASR